MGSRAVLLVRRDGSGVAYTRTGRPFFPQPSLNAALVARTATAVDGAGLFDELGSEWVLLDTELLPWSAKATGLIREQYASVGAAARGALPAGLAALDAAAARGLAIGPIRDRLAARLDGAGRFTEVYRRYCWPTDGLAGVRLAPFQVLASERASHLGRDHGWHLASVRPACRRRWGAVPDHRAPDSRPDRRGGGRRDDPVVAVPHGGRWRGNGRQALRRCGPTGRLGAGPARHQVPRPGLPSDHLWGRLHRAGAVDAAARSAGSGASGHSRPGSTRWESPR